MANPDIEPARVARVTEIEMGNELPVAMEKELADTAEVVRSLPGLVEAYWLIDRASGKGISVTTWTTADSMREAESVAASAERLGAPPEVGSYEVLAEAGAGGDHAAWARVLAVAGAPETWEVASKVIRERIAPVAAQLPGFRGGRWFADMTTGRGLTLMMWDSESSLLNAEARAAEGRRRAAEATGHTILSVDTYEVMLQLP
jgi:hypothetical protein